MYFSLQYSALFACKKHYENLGVIWYDAHGDLNTAETSPSGNIHGMPLAVSLGIGHPSLTNIMGYTPKIKPENVMIIGARSLDEGERKLIKEGIRILWWKRAYKSPFSKFLISVEISTPKLSVMS
ncbi:arginase family protein [Aeribacillus sp. FSL K6-1121]|uniref:arginase family protein n=1 Tax=Aeribacillus sp. FSL K6-1121 TaxID=2954745 RepID=UPI0030FCF44B